MSKPPRDPDLGPLTPSPVGFEEPAFLSVLLSLCGDTGDHADASHHTEIQRQPGSHTKRQSQPRSLHQGERWSAFTRCYDAVSVIKTRDLEDINKLQCSFVLI